MARRACRRDRTALAAASALVVLCASGTAARRRRVTATEAAIFETVNRATGAVRAPAWVVMQAGSLGAVVVAASVRAARHGRRAGTVTLVAGAGVWTAMKVVKPVVGRGRPTVYLAGVRVRGAPQTGLGYPSGHAAVAATLALTTIRGGCPRHLGLAVAAAVGAGRIYSGAHLPLDVVGGLAAGSLTGLLGRHVIEQMPGATCRAW